MNVFTRVAFLCVYVHMELGRAIGGNGESLKGCWLYRFLGVDVTHEGGRGSDDNVHMTLRVTKSICEWPLSGWLFFNNR